MRCARAIPMPGKSGGLTLVIAGSVVVLLHCGACRSERAVVGSFAPFPQYPSTPQIVPAKAVLGSDSVPGAKVHVPTGGRMFVQYPWGRRGARAKPYERVVTSEGRLEGSLIGQVDFPIEQYLDPHSERRPRPTLNWPTAGGRDLDCFFMEFKPLIPEWPTGIGPGESVEARAEVVAYERDGTPFATGRVRRTMRLGGYETIHVGGHVFEGTARMEAHTELTFGWLATMRVSETAWFASGVGMVRREEHYGGRALWLFRFGGASEYVSAEFAEIGMNVVADRFKQADGVGSISEPRESEPGIEGDRPTHPASWSHMAICFERSGRRLQVSGVAVEWAGLD